MSDPDSDNAGVVIPPPLVLLIVVLACTAIEIWTYIPRLAVPQPLSLILGIVIAVLGLALGLSGIGLFLRHKVHPAPTKPVPRLVTDGAYRFTRNPMYLGILVALLGVALSFGSFAFLAGSMVMFLFLRLYVVPREEAYMARRFGPDYAAYRARVRRWI